MKGFVWDPFVIGMVVFVLFIALPIVSNIGNNTTRQVIANSNLTAAQTKTITSISTEMFNNTNDVMIIFLYFMLILASFISAGYEGANPAATLLLGLFFIILAEIVSFGIADVAHNYINNQNNLAIKPHMTLSTYLMENLPIFNGFATIAYIIYVISKREVLVESLPGGIGGGGGWVST